MTPTEEHYAFYEGIGLAITQWGHVERALLDALAICANDTDDFSMLGHGFFAIENFRSKLAFADEVLRQKIKEKVHLDDWALLLERMRSASAQRNRLAHDRVVISLVAKPGRRFCLTPWLKNVSPLGTRDIRSMHATFAALVFSLQNFSYAIRGLKEPHPKSFEEATSPPPALAVLRRQMHEVLGHPLKSQGKS
jgi:hypothetical protein